MNAEHINYGLREIVKVPTVNCDVLDKSAEVCNGQR